jgi:hypothetical protein
VNEDFKELGFQLIENKPGFIYKKSVFDEEFLAWNVMGSDDRSYEKKIITWGGKMYLGQVNR